MIWTSEQHDKKMKCNLCSKHQFLDFTFSDKCLKKLIKIIPSFLLFDCCSVIEDGLDTQDFLNSATVVERSSSHHNQIGKSFQLHAKHNCNQELTYDLECIQENILCRMAICTSVNVHSIMWSIILTLHNSYTCVSALSNVERNQTLWSTWGGEFDVLAPSSCFPCLSESYLQDNRLRSYVLPDMGSISENWYQDQTFQTRLNREYMLFWKKIGIYGTFKQQMNNDATTYESSGTIPSSNWAKGWIFRPNTRVCSVSLHIKGFYNLEKPWPVIQFSNTHPDKTFLTTLSNKTESSYFWFHDFSPKYNSSHNVPQYFIFSH